MGADRRLERLCSGPSFLSGIDEGSEAELLDLMLGVIEEIGWGCGVE